MYFGAGARSDLARVIAATGVNNQYLIGKGGTRDARFDATRFVHCENADA
jgi:hypothetical protein